MEEGLKIKHEEPKLRLMLHDYETMFSGHNLKFNLGWLLVLLVLGSIFYLGPSTLDPTTHIVFRVLMFMNNFFLLGWGALLLFSLFAPLFVRLVSPLCILVLGIIEILIHVVRYFIDVLLIDSIKESFLYPKPEEREDKDRSLTKT
jgi:hypothetical protein